MADGAQVVLKRVYSLESGNDEELKIMLLVSSPALKNDPSNHCVQMLEWFPMQDAEEPHLTEDDRVITVVPLLRKWMKPPFKLAVEALSFVRQIIEVGFSLSLLLMLMTNRDRRASFSYTNITSRIGRLYIPVLSL